MDNDTTKWCPEAWLDEYPACLVTDPTELVVQGGDTGWLLQNPDWPEEEWPAPMSLEPGQIVDFCAHRNYGLFTLTIQEDRSFAVAPDLPADANLFRLSDGDDDIWETIVDLVKNGDTTGPHEAPLSPGEYDVDAWHWSDGWPFRFDVEDGKPRFVRCAGRS